MGKPKRFQKTKKVSVLGSDDEELYNDMEEPDPKSKDFLFNEIDNYNNSREYIPLASDNEEEQMPRNIQEEVLALPDDSDDDDIDDDDDEGIYDRNFYSAMVQKDEIASDVEDYEDENLPNEKAWGKRKSSYYNTDYVDKDYDGFQGSDTELAEAEEKEATRIQKRLLQELSEEDFGLEWITPINKSVDRSQDLEKLKVSTDLSTLSDSEKIEILKKESPELLIVVKDFEHRMTELKDKILPLIPLVEDGRIPPGPGADYLTIKKKLIYMYCTNISFYLMIRCKDVNVKHHPVLKRLLTFRKLLDQLEPTAEKLEPDIQSALQMLKEGREIRPYMEHPSSKEELKIPKQKQKKHNQLNGKKRVSFVDDKVEKNSSSKKLKRTQMETADEKEALEMYEMMKKRTQKKQTDEMLPGDESNEDDEKTKEHETNLRHDDPETADEKREITYEIAKNKGLTPHRKKEYRNPRVRHRVKFQKAKVRRKGQYKEPRKELQRYGGEMSGIRIGSKRGIKLK